MFVERTGYFASADAGASFHYNIPSNYGDLHVGIFNGENYNKAEVNDQKAIMIRGSVRPFATAAPILRGLRASVFYDGDNYLKDAERTRALGNVTFEHKFLTLGFEYLDAHDQLSARAGFPDVHSRGYSVWATPKQSSTGVGWEGLLRYDHLTPNTSSAFAPFATAGNTTTAFESLQQNRVIVGAAYWFPHQGNVTSALLVDYDGQLFKNLATPPAKNIGVHALINF
jgi:hypothetical protein